MRCLCCGKKLSVSEQTEGWHKKCIKSFFGISDMPELDISDKVLERIANDNINKGMTVTGVQKKMSVHLSKDDKYRLTIVGYPTGYILKPQSDDYVNLPEAEYLNMKMAESIGINTV
ncbi:MAG: type II toxin-antitoxin system HipA family toxin, partial [Lachnospiraceae bacterium]|nr:type II toxin-antitoxin system HipA family toxin [Lachnospiraceae bacterium]